MSYVAEVLDALLTLGKQTKGLVMVMSGKWSSCNCRVSVKALWSSSAMKLRLLTSRKSLVMNSQCLTSWLICPTSTIPCPVEGRVNLFSHDTKHLLVLDLLRYQKWPHLETNVDIFSLLLIKLIQFSVIFLIRITSLFVLHVEEILSHRWAYRFTSRPWREPRTLTVTICWTNICTEAGKRYSILVTTFIIMTKGGQLKGFHFHCPSLLNEQN